MRIEYCGVCDKGQKRKINQDAVLMRVQDQTGLFIVADGMGGHLHGEAASETIVVELGRWWKKFSQCVYRQNFTDAVFELKQQLGLANRMIYEKYQDSGICGSTVAILFIYGKNYCIFSSGDSRIYYRNAFKWKRLTIDDIWENQPEIIENYTPEQMKKHANFGRLVHAIGIGEDTVVNGKTDILRDKDSFLLCSDGFYKMCETKDIRKILKNYKNGKSGEELLRQALQKVYENGASDNISMVLVRVQGV